MFKFIILFAACATLAYTATTPDELRREFETVENEVRELEKAAVESILTAEEILIAIVQKIEETYGLIIESDNEAFRAAAQEVLSANFDNQAVQRCVEQLSMKLVLVSLEEAFGSAVSNAEEAFRSGAVSIRNAIKQLEELGRKIRECSESTCAETLSASLTALEATIKSTIESAVSAIESAASCLNSSSITFDESAYKSAVDKLTTQVKECANANDDGGDTTVTW